MKSQGLGDTVAKVLKFFYIDRLADKIAHILGYEDCGCTRRKNILNRMFPYTKRKNSYVKCRSNSRERST